MASTIKVDNVQNQPGTNIVSKCGTDVTLGASGDTVALAAGASQTGFGRTGTVDWETSIQTGTVTAVTGKGYFVNTTSGGITVNLPAGVVGSIVAVSDYASTAASNNITITANGSEKINGVNDDYPISTAGLAVTLVYADAARGWKSVTGSDADATGIVPAYVVATGGTPCAGATSGDYKIHTFTGPGSLVVSDAGNAGGSNTLDYMVVAGAGGGGSNGGGGGAGGFRESVPSPAAWTASPIAKSAGGITAVASSYSIVVGGGGAGSPGSPTCGVKGNDSSFSTITSTGGGKGGGWATPGGGGGDGGSGGGGGMPAPGGSLYCGGAGDTPDTTPDQGKPGGQGWHESGVSSWGGGGGGATVAGFNGTPSENGGNGGTGATTSISATPTAYAGGGGGRPNSPVSGTGGTGGGGDAGGPQSPSNAGVAGIVNTGGGGGGGSNVSPCVGAGGGSGIVIIRYKFQ